VDNAAQRNRARVDTSTLFLGAKEKEYNDVPAVGGIEIEEVHLSAYPILPPYVALLEPRQDDIWLSPRLRAIFLNQPLEPWEQVAITKFKSLVLADLSLKSDDPVPRWLQPHMTRVLQQCKYKPEEAVKLYRNLLVERVTKLPVTYTDVKNDLGTGFVYWHGRDARARPLMVISLGRGVTFIDRPEALQKLFMFHMEFAVRHLLVPGRVECWSVIIDCSGAENLPPWKGKEMAQVLGSVLGKVYSGRMIWLRLFNFPTSFVARALRVCVEGVVSALGKADKVSFVRQEETQSWYSGLVAPGQLEQRFGGSAPDVPASEVYPYRMFATPDGHTSRPANGTCTVASSLHSFTDVAFHEGLLWADCLQQPSGARSWREAAAKFPLPKSAAQAADVTACSDMASWMRCMSASVEGSNTSCPNSTADEITTCVSEESGRIVSWV
jgi:hypothetical protein